MIYSTNDVTETPIFTLSTKRRFPMNIKTEREDDAIINELHILEDDDEASPRKSRQQAFKLWRSMYPSRN